MLIPTWIQNATFALIVMTGLVFLCMPRYQLAGEQLLSDTQFSTDQSPWRLVGQAGAVERSRTGLVLFGGDGLARARQFIASPDADGLRIKAITRYDGEPVNRAGDLRVLLIGYGVRERWDMPFASLEAIADGREHHQQADIRLDASVDQYAVSAMNRGVPSPYAVTQIELYPLQDSLIFVWLRQVLGLGWAALGLIYLIGLMRLRGAGWLRWSVGAGAGITVVGVMLPKPWLIGVSRSLHRELVAQVPMMEQLGTFTNLLDRTQNIAHVVLFAALTTLLTLLRPEQRLVSLVSTVVTFAAATEVLQWFALDREPQLGDFGRDLVGVALGLLFGLALLALRGADDSRRQRVQGETCPLLFCDKT